MLADATVPPEIGETQAQVQELLTAGRSVDVGRRFQSPAWRAPGAGARLDVLDAQVALGQGRLDEADRLAAAAERAGLRAVACEALEVVGRVARQRDLRAAEAAFARAASPNGPTSIGTIAAAVNRCIRHRHSRR
jgi:hypothetical protein